MHAYWSHMKIIKVVTLNVERTMYFLFISFNPYLFIRGLSCPRNIQTSLTQNCLKLTMPRFPYNLLCVSCGGISILKNCIGQVLAWKSGLKLFLLHLGPSCPLQTILLGDLLGCGCLLQIVITVWHIFCLIEAHQTAIYSLQRALTLIPTNKNFKKVRQMVILTCRGLLHCTRLDGQHNPLRTYQDAFFFKGREAL
jgi:hypothetical protein